MHESLTTRVSIPLDSLRASRRADLVELLLGASLDLIPEAIAGSQVKMDRLHEIGVIIDRIVTEKPHPADEPF